MQKRLLDWLIPEAQTPEEQAANRTWLQVLVFSALTAIILYLALNWNADIPREYIVFLVLLGLFLLVLLLFFNRHEYTRLIIAILSLTNLAAMLLATYAFGGVRSNSYVGILVALVIIAMFLRGWVTILSTALVIVFGGVLALGETQGWYQPTQESSPIRDWASISLIFALISTLIGVVSQKARQIFARNYQEILERRRAEATLQEQTRYLAVLHETTLAIINRLELKPLLESILQAALELTGTEHGYVDMYLPERRGFLKHATRGIFAQWPNQFLSQDQGITGEVFRTGKSVMIADYPSWPNQVPLYASGFHAIAAAPMKVRGEVIGIIGLAYTEAGRVFSARQMQSLEQFAELASLAVDNARLYESARQELTERKRIQESLAQSQENLRLALDAAQMGIWTWNIQTNEVSWSDSVYKIFGIEKTAAPITYQHYLSFIPPSDRLKVQETINKSLADPNQFYFIEHPIILPDGTTRWISAQGRVYTDEAGRPVRMGGTVMDITARKLSETALYEAHHQLEVNAHILERRSQLLQVAAEVSRVASAILDPSDLSQQVVELVQQRFGLYYVGLFLIDEQGEDIVLRAATGEAGREMLKAGHRFPIGNSSMVGWCVANRRARIALDVGEDAVRFNNPLLPNTRSELALPLISRGQILGALTIQSDQEAAFSDEDIETFQTMADQLANAIQNARLYDQLERELEERKRAEMQVRQLNAELEERVERRTLALKASEERFRALADNNPLRIRRYDRECRYLYANRVSNDPDFEPQQIIGKTIREVVENPELVELAERCIRQVFETGQPMQTEYQYDEHSFALWYLAPEFGPDGQVISVVTTTLDISERRRMEDELRARTLELQASNRELESFSYSVSHDLRAPLRALDGFSRILLEDFQAYLPEEAQQYLKRIREATQQMSQLIDDMLRLSRISRAELRRDPISLTELARQIVENLQSQEPERSARILIQENLIANADQGLLRLALENLFNNAWKFSAKSNPTEIEFGKTLVDGRETFFIRDNGVGFDMAYADKLFGVFQRLHSPSEFPGTGVGLAIVQRVIHRHGGRIWAQSAPGQGATFYFTL
ncbi:MAG: hypothetical protein DDG60_01175 [Anaerolineae bacterium]|nr:MAG: hypothetical protein DDG60_01175 [Anaerolineae bacterium]